MASYSNGPSTMTRASYDTGAYHPQGPGGNMSGAGRGTMGGPSPYHSHPSNHYQGVPTNPSQDPYHAHHSPPSNYYSQPQPGQPGGPTADYSTSHPGANSSGPYPVVRSRAPGGRVMGNPNPPSDQPSGGMQRSANPVTTQAQDHARARESRASSHDLSQSQPNKAAPPDHAQTSSTGPQPPPPMQIPMMPFQYSNNNGTSQAGLNDFSLSALDGGLDDQVRSTILPFPLGL